ncbi:MAG: alpha/beta hydrolase [Thermoguttaceae bacterium]|nr:alpha/beta hydrolase [Thermoguttaceae bacterium]
MKIEYQSFISDDGVEIKYVDMGAGRPLVFVIGYDETVQTSISFLSRLSERFRCIAFDHRGFGASPASANVGIDRSACDLNRLLEVLDLDDVALVGYSMGGSVAFSYFRQFGGARVSRLVLADTSPKLINEGDWSLGLWQGRYGREDFERDLATLVSDPALFHLSFYLRAATPSQIDAPPSFPPFDDPEAWLARVVEHTGIKERFIRRVFFVERSEERRALEREYWNSMTGADYLTSVSLIDKPTLCLFADPGSFYSPLTGKWLVDHIPNAQLATIPNACHVFPKENGEDFVQNIFDFCLK